MTKPWILAHRGASGHRPEHTLAAYQLAVDLGADFIEPDLVSTRDGVLVARHENEIGGTSDVAGRSEFAGRRATKMIDGVSLTGWFTEDFTLAELKTLRAVERLPELRPANTGFDGRYEIATLDELLTLLARNNAGREQPVGLCAEIKHSTYFSSIGLPIEPALLASLDRHGLDTADKPVIIESMETANLRALAQQTGVTLVQLMMDYGRPYDFTATGDVREYSDLTTPDALRDIATYAHGIGPNKKQVIPRDRSGRSLGATRLVRDAHAAGLFVVVWTLRDENHYLPAELRRSGGDRGDSVREYEYFFDAGVDGVFSDFTDTAVDARRDWLGRRGGRG